VDTGSILRNPRRRLSSAGPCCIDAARLFHSAFWSEKLLDEGEGKKAHERSKLACCIDGKANSLQAFSR
jgi:hypothetical protein